MHQKDLSDKALQLKRSGKATFTVDETAALLGISRPTAYEGCRTGDIPSIRVGRRLLVPRAALQQLLGGSSVQLELSIAADAE
jgi:excisionase family DNA binding protein